MQPSISFDGGIIIFKENIPGRAAIELYLLRETIVRELNSRPSRGSFQDVLTVILAGAREVQGGKPLGFTRANSNLTLVGSYIQK